MIPSLEKPAIRRAAALAILAALLLGLHGVLIHPYLQAMDELHDSIAQLKIAIPRYRSAAGQLPGLRDRLATLQQNAASPGFLTEKTEALAAATLQERLKTSLAAAGGTLASIQVLAGREEGQAYRVVIRGQMTVRIDELQRVIYDIESGFPTLFVDNLEIRAVSAARETAAAEGGLLDVGFDVCGYLWRD